MAYRTLKCDEDTMCLTVDSGGDLVIAGYEEGHVRLWDVRCDAPVLSGRCGQSVDAASVCFGRRHTPFQLVYVAAGASVYAVDLRKTDTSTFDSGGPILTVDDINQLTVSDNGEMMAVADDSGTITLIDMTKADEGRPLATLKKHRNVAYAVQFRPGKPRELVSGGYDCCLVHWDALKSRVLSATDLASHNDPEWPLPASFNPSYVLSCSFVHLDPNASNKANVVIAGTENGNLHCFRCDKNLLHCKTFRAHALGVTQVRVIGDCPIREDEEGDEPNNSSVVCTGGNDGKIRFWSASAMFANDRKAEAIVTVDHGAKINWLDAFRDRTVLVCDTSPHITMLPFDH